MAGDGFLPFLIHLEVPKRMKLHAGELSFNVLESRSGHAKVARWVGWGLYCRPGIEVTDNGIFEAQPISMAAPRSGNSHSRDWEEGILISSGRQKSENEN